MGCSSSKATQLSSDIKEIIIPNFTTIESTIYGKVVSSSAKSMILGESSHCGKKYSDISIPFSEHSGASKISGIYVCVSKVPNDAKLLRIYFHERDAIHRYQFSLPSVEQGSWFLLPIDNDRLRSVTKCFIRGYDSSGNDSFALNSLIFVRDETAVEAEMRQGRELTEKFEETVSTFLRTGDRFSCPIPRDDPRVRAPSFFKVSAGDNSLHTFSKWYDKSAWARKMLRGQSEVSLSHIYVPFRIPSNLECAYICLHKDFHPLSIKATIFDREGVPYYRKYRFTPLKNEYEWHRISIELDDVVSVDVQLQVGTEKMKFSRRSCISSLLFLSKEGTIQPVQKLMSTIVNKMSSFFF
ncbi:hypothetical protein ADUPG1_007088 [Aduncisulcus paluster]|uniref:Uncharacterized protein n=1 Tax=Aduncisulcus paluster TaxID=2918883 RepID=A0ABQ5KKN4_9EUKA|nr:hypothetical protein ADUPG1_007088 [Aduncisulcus paluster]